MTFDSALGNPHHVGSHATSHSIDGACSNLTFPHKTLEQPVLSKLHNVRYNPRLGAEEDPHFTDEEADGYSQCSSDEYYSQLSDSTISTSPLDEESSSLPPQGSSQLESQGARSVSSRQNACEPTVAHRLPHLGQHKLQACKRLPLPLPTPPSSSRLRHGVPFRPKPVEVQPQNGDAVLPLQIDTSRVASDVQRSRMRPQENISENIFSANRRGRSACNGVAPPRLRRDTDQTDAVVKMIVLFCTNLINSIWSTSASIETTSHQSGSNVLPLQVFITETLRRSKTSYSTLQIALYYLILLKQCLPPYAAGRQSTQGCRAMQCGRRMFLTALILASKYLQDRNYSARAWSKISGLPMKEINENERRYLNIVSWDLHVPKDTFENWSKIVLNVCRLSVEQDITSRDVTSFPPPGPGSSGQACFSKLQNMCQEGISALQSWWLLNLRSLCTEIIKCPQKTDKYVCSISPFRDSSYLPRPVVDSTWQDELSNTLPGDSISSSKTLPRLPSIDSISKHFSSPDGFNSPTGKLTMPAPPMLANLPTPLQTPRGMDMKSMWTPQLSGSNLRCRASASALSNLDQRRCPMANLMTCPPPKPKPQPRSTWSEFEATPRRNIPDRSLTSSPESVMSDSCPSVFSMPPRSRSSSISSTSSWLTSSSSASVAAEKQKVERPSRHLNEVQHQFALEVSHQVSFARPEPLSLSPSKLGLERIERPQTAFKVPFDTQTFGKPAARPESRVYQGYGTNDHVSLRGGACQTAMHQNAEPTPWSRPPLSRRLTQISDPELTPTTAPHMLKRSRSESFDHVGDKTQTLSHEKANAASKVEAGNPFYGVADLIKEIVTPSQPYLQPRMPLQYGVQNKRIALQSPSPAAMLASIHLQKDIMLQG